MLQGKVLHWVPDTDLRNSHTGLAQIAKDQLKVKVDQLRPGEFVMFINTAWTAFKVYCAHNIILHHKQPEGHRLNPKAVMALPHFIKGQHIGYDKALTAVIEDEYRARYGHEPERS